jgi:LCP family protein required for cell wall assembly
LLNQAWMRVWHRLLVLGAGLALLGSLGAHLLRYRPFRAAPELIEARRSQRDAPAIEPELRALPRQLLPTLQAATPPLSQTENLLLAGIDSRPDASAPSRLGRTDALVLVVIDRRSKHVGLVGIPRDLVLDLPDEGPVRINTVFLRGCRVGGADEGARRLGQAVRHLLGLTVDHTVFLDHAGFEALVDDLGGIAVHVACPIRDRFIDPRGPDGRVELRLEAGTHWLDGRTALMFARSRHGRGVTDRARRQLAVLAGLRDRVRQLGSHHVAELIPRLRQTVYTDMTTLELLRLLRLALDVPRERIHGLVLDWRHVTPVQLDDGRRVMLPRPEAIAQDLSRLFEAGPPGARRAAACPPMDAALR